jgi:hypothetical protein
MKARARGFYLPVVALFALCALAAVGLLAERATSAISITVSAVTRRAAAESSCLSLAFAEDWLMTSITRGDFPSRGGWAADPWERVEAVAGDGSRASSSSRSHGIVAYVADADYPPGLFTGDLAKNASTPFIPRISAEETERFYVRFYYLRGEAPIEGFDLKSVCEELLSVSMDKLTGMVVARRLYYRSRVE